MKKKLGIAILSFIIIIGLLFLSTGGKVTGVMLTDYAISEDGKVMTLEVGLASSIGYIRTCKVREKDNSKQITFYSTYGLNSTLGAKSEFQVELNASCNEIYFYTGKGEYKLLLQKNSKTNEWVKMKQ